MPIDGARPSHVIDGGTRAPLNLSELHFAGEREARVVVGNSVNLRGSQ